LRCGVEVRISDGGGAPNRNGAYAAFRIDDFTQNQGIGKILTPLGDTYYHGSQAEWIMEQSSSAMSTPKCLKRSP
jgi:hypothetical protein